VVVFGVAPLGALAVGRPLELAVDVAGKAGLVDGDLGASLVIELVSVIEDEFGCLERLLPENPQGLATKLYSNGTPV
jgi:hypothetical protein